MSAPGPPRPRPAPRASARRLRHGVMALMVLACATVSAALATALAARFSARFDATATGEFALSPRTLGVLDALGGDWEIVVAADRRAADAATRRRVRDVLEEMRRRAPALRVTWLDADAPAGARDHLDLLERLRRRDAALDAHVAALGEAMAAMEETAAYFGAPLADGLRRAAAAVGDADEAAVKQRQFLSGNADAARAESARLLDAVRAARAALEEGDQPGRIPPTDDVARALAAHLRPLAAAAATLARELDAMARAPGAPAALRDALAGPAERLDAIRQRLAVSLDAAERLRATDLVKARRLLESASCAVVVGPNGLTAVDGAQLFPAPDPGGAPGADAGRRAEDLLATALAAVASPVKPLVVLVHAEPAPFALETPVFRDALDRLALRGVEVVEWAAAVEERPPPVPGPPGRPVVYLVHSTDASTGPANDPALSGPARAARLGRAVGDLLERGESVLMCINPWALARIGEPDPTVAPLAALGWRADTARPLIREATGAGGSPVVVRWHDVRAEPADHPLAAALAGLPTLLPWPVPLRPAAGEAGGPADAGAAAAPLFRVRDGGAWGESQWLTLWQSQGDPAARGPAAPSADPQRDAVDRPWTVALALERARGDARQRVVVVGSNGWFTRGITSAGASRVDGRVAARFPGNLELLESAVYWLAGRDDMIARTPAALAVPRVRDLGPRELAAARWLVVGALPLLTLAAGITWRMLRG